MYEGAIQDLLDALGSLPGVGPKSAQRIAFHLLDAPVEDVNRLADLLRDVKAKAKFCEVCFNVAEAERCRQRAVEDGERARRAAEQDVLGQRPMDRD